MFRGGCLSQSYIEWSTITSEPEVLQTVKGMHNKITSLLPKINSFQYSFNEIENEFVRQEIKHLLVKGVIAHTKHKP